MSREEKADPETQESGPTLTTTTTSKSKLTDDEVEVIIEYVFGHRKAAIQSFLESHKLPKSGKKEELRTRIEDALNKALSRLMTLSRCWITSRDGAINTFTCTRHRQGNRSCGRRKRKQRND